MSLDEKPWVVVELAAVAEVVGGQTGEDRRVPREELQGDQMEHRV